VRVLVVRTYILNTHTQRGYMKKILLLMLMIFGISFGQCKLVTFGDTTYNDFGDMQTTNINTYGKVYDESEENMMLFDKSYVSLYDANQYSLDCDSIAIRNNETKKVITVYKSDFYASDSNYVNGAVFENNDNYIPIINLFKTAKTVTVVYYMTYIEDYSEDGCGDPECTICYPDGYKSKDSSEITPEYKVNSARSTFNMKNFTKVYKKCLK
jgi:hypothetical protein